MNKHYYFLTVLFTALIGVFTNLHAQEPAELGNYQITKIGNPVFQVATNQWYLMGRNKYLVDKGGDNGYVFEDTYETYDETAKIANAACTSTDNWSCTGSNTFHYDTWSTGNGMTSNFLEYWVGQPTNLSDATISHSRITGLTAGIYRVTVEATCCSEANNANVNGGSFWATGSTTTSVNLNTGEPGAGNFTGWHGTYSLFVPVGDAGTLDIGFTINGANFNWFAFKNVTLTRMGEPFSVVNVPNGACNEGNSSSLTNWTKTGTGTLSKQNGNARYNLGDTWTGNAGEIYNNGNVFPDANTKVYHEQLTGLQNGKYQISIDARVAGTEPTPVVNPTVTVIAPFEYTFTAPSLYYNQGAQSVNTSDILAAIGITDGDVTKANVYVEDGNGVRTLANDHSTCPCDGWRDANGLFKNWPDGDFYIKFNPAAAANQAYEIGLMPEKKVGSAAYTAKYVYVNKTTLAEVPVLIHVNYGTSFHYEVTTPIGSVQGINYYQAAPIDVDIAAIRTVIGAGSDNDYTVYADDGASTVRGTTNGWRNADGEFQAWGAESYVYVQDESKSHYVVGGHPDHCNEVGSYTTRLIYKHNTTGATAAVYITLTYTAEFHYGAETQTGSVENTNYYQNSPVIVTDIETIRTALLASSLDDITVYSEEPDGTRVLGVRKDTNGWRDASGAFHAWGDTDSYFYLQETDKQNYVMGGYPDHSNAPGSYTAKLIYRNNSNGKEIPVYFTLTYYSDPTFFANGQRVRLSTGTKHTGSGYMGYRGTYTLEATVTDGKLDFGFDIPQGYWKWLSFRDVKLYYLGAQGLKVSNGMPTALGALTPNNPIPANDAKRYLVRFTNDGWGAKGQYWQMQMGTGNYVAAPAGDGAVAECGDAGKFYIYLAEGTRHDDTMDQDLWTVAKDIVLVKPTDGGGYLYYMHDNGVDNIVSFTTNPNNTDEKWGVDINVGNPFTLYPVDVCEINPTTPTLSGPEASTTAAPKFYKIKSVGQNDYASYSSITASQYPQLVDYAVGGYAVMGRTSSDVTGNSYWWFSDASSEGYQHQSSKGTKRVHIHNVMMHDVDYSYENHHDEALHSPVEGMVRMYRDNANTQPTDSCLYYLLPTTADGQNGFAISHSEYSGTPNDSWYSAEQVVNEIGQHSNLSWQRNYKTDLNSLYTFELAPISEVWAAVLATKRADMHEGAYFSPTKETLDAIFNKAEYQTANINASNFFARLNALSTELYNAATDASLPTLAPETGGRFYFKNYAVPNYYLAYGRDMDTEDTRLTITQADKPEAANVWEVIPFSDPTLIVRLDDQPVYNGFPSAYYETLPHKPLQRFWLRNRATGHFVTHAPVDKSGLEKLGEGVWRMYDGDTFIGGQSEVGTVNSLDREDADLWYLDVVTNPRTGVRTGVLRTLFCYDYGPWTGTSWDGSYASNGRAIGETGAAIAGYNYPVIQWSLSRHIGNNGKPAAECIPALYAWGVTATDHTRAFSQWVIYDIDTDLPEVGVNYTLKNKYSGKYAYWNGAADGGSLQQTEKVEDIANNGANDNQNRGVWTLVDLATPASDHWRIANRWAIASEQSKTKLNPLKLNYTIAENNGSTFYLPQSNIDPKGIAIGTSSNPPANGEGTWLISYDNKTGVTQGKSENDRAVWGIDKVDRMYDDVVYELSKMLSNVHDGQEIFWMNNVASYNEYITKWNQYSTGNYENVTVNNEYPTYKVIKDLINGIIGDDEFIMPVKKSGSGNRYLIRNKETGRYLTDYGQLMTVDSAAVSLYSIWNLDLDESNADKYLYTLTNEGAAHVMDAADGVRTTKNVKYMTFAPTSGFQMGSTEMKLHFRPDGEGYARLHYSADGDHDMDDDKVLYGPSWGNRVVQSQVLKTNNVFWEVIPVAKFFTNARTTERFKTETALVQQTIRDMEGYSGGPISLTDTDPTRDQGTYKLENLPGAITGATGSAAGLATIIGNLWQLDEMFLLQWKPGFPVYLDNMFRPTPGARLTTGTGSDWTTTATKDESTASQTFEFAGTMNGSYTLVNKSNSKLLATSTAEGATATATTEAANAAQLTVTEIVPSIYSIKDGENRYLSIDDEGNVEWESICGYGALWRIKCNDYEQPTIQKISGVSQIWQGDFINTYSSEYDTQMKASDGVKVYYAKNATSGGGHGFGDGYDASGNATNEKTQQQLQITFYEVENEGGYYHLEALQPYLIVKSPTAVADASVAKTKANNDEIKVWSKHKGTYEGGTLVGKNLLTRLDGEVTIDATNHRKFYELNYIAPGTQVGSIGGQPVYAFGAGFYTPPIGRKFKAGKCVIEASAIGAWLSELRTKVNEVKGEVEPTAIEVILENLDGSTTDLTDLQLDVDNHLADGPVYDLSGRKIADSLRDVSHKGIYVVNGQKVLKK